MSKTNRYLFWAAALLVANSAYLYAAGDPVPFYFANILLHVALGLVLIVPFAAWWWRRRSNPAIFGGGALLLLSGPAQAGGLLPGDVLIEANGRWLAGESDLNGVLNVVDPDRGY